MAAALVRKVEAAAGVALRQQLLERDGLIDSGKDSATALLGGLDRDRLQSFKLHPLCHRALGHDRQQPRRAELGRFLNQPISLRSLYRCEGKPDVGSRLRFARLPFDRERHALLGGLGDAGEPLARSAIEH